MLGLVPATELPSKAISIYSALSKVIKGSACLRFSSNSNTYHNSAETAIRPSTIGLVARVEEAIHNKCAAASKM